MKINFVNFPRISSNLEIDKINPKERIIKQQTDEKEKYGEFENV